MAFYLFEDSDQVIIQAQKAVNPYTWSKWRKQSRQES